jgi:hypothetical protein
MKNGTFSVASSAAIFCVPGNQAGHLEEIPTVHVIAQLAYAEHLLVRLSHIFSGSSLPVCTMLR